MSNDHATALLALNEANRALKVARDAFRRLGEKQAARLTTEMAEDTLELMAAVARGQRDQAVVS